MCGAHAENLDVETYMRRDNDHVCKTGDVIRRAVPYFRARAIPTGAAIADWLSSCAMQADSMTGPGDYDVCDEPASVRHAVHVALSVPWETP